MTEEEKEVAKRLLIQQLPLKTLKKSETAEA